jgi:heat-inducible transcriptional repressor
MNGIEEVRVPERRLRMNQNREYQILKLIVEEYIQTSEPVGSKGLLEKYKLDCSSATIRNAMALLEKDGYIEKTHVSSGRVPSSKGYQYYLDHLDSKSLVNEVDLDFQKEFQSVLANKTSSMEDALSKSCQLLSEMTKMATVVLGPKADQECLVSIQFLPLNASQAMGIFITDSGYVEKKTFVIPKGSPVSLATMQSAVKVLNDRLVGTKVTDLEAKAKAIAPLIIKMFGNSGEFVMRAFLEAMINFASKRFEVYGQKNLLSLPEFADDNEAFLNAVDALDDPHKLEHDMASNDDLGNVKVGFTNDTAGDLAIVSKTLNNKESLALIGPKRMDYKKVLGILDYVIYMLEKKFSPEGENQNALVPVSEPSDVPNKRSPKEAGSRKAKKGVTQ